MIDRLAIWIATCGPLGRIKVAPGAFGSLVGLVLSLVVWRNPLFSIGFTVILFLTAVWSSDLVTRKSGEKDPTFVIIDEVLGMFVSLLFLPPRWEVYVAGFICFRIFDIVKPPPIRMLERLDQGMGVVLDDFAAGVYANLILRLLVRYAHL